ncbi:MAG: hypothetical protein ASARMPREDX12_005521 [Alectoria sarmentosa]|nr:MAG: hypothetical protein ASARMPREDX12_005521 [Alectoria sarmentosa]
MHGSPQLGLEEKMELLGNKLRKRVAQKIPRPNFNGTLTMGLMGMASLLLGAHAAMAMVEQGGILPWYFTITAVAENWTQLPFDQQWRLFVSDVPYRVDIQDGDDIMTQLSTNEDSVSRSLQRLGRLRAGRVLFRGSRVRTQAVNTVIIMVSVVAHDNPLSSVKRLFTKMSSIGVFVTGTAFFAAVQLLALPMAVMVLTFILSAGVFGRGFANWIVTRIDREEPLIHIIVKDAKEAHQVISRVLELDHQSPHEESAEEGEKSGRLVQVEIGGHIFIKHRRVAHRSPWHVRVWGIMANPFDLRKVGEDCMDDVSNRYETVHFGKSATSYASPSPSSYQMVPLAPDSQ